MEPVTFNYSSDLAFNHPKKGHSFGFKYKNVLELLMDHKNNQPRPPPLITPNQESFVWIYFKKSTRYHVSSCEGGQAPIAHIGDLSFQCIILIFQPIPCCHTCTCMQCRCCEGTVLSGATAGSAVEDCPIRSESKSRYDLSHLSRPYPQPTEHLAYTCPYILPKHLSKNVQICIKTSHSLKGNQLKRDSIDH